MDLAKEARDFADELERILRPAIGKDIEFQARSTPTRSTAVVVPVGEKLPLRLPGESDDLAWLKVEYRLGVDPEGEYMSVQRSTFGLWVQLADGKARPVVRIEYDRHKTSKPPAHVHFHAESTELGWIYGRSGKPVPRMEELHFPLGGHRFRPTIEDFVEFLDREGIHTDWASNDWPEAFTKSRNRWYSRQAKATARRFPKQTAEALADLGWQVTSPS